MATYLMFGKYTRDSIKHISAQRTQEAKALIEKHGGNIVSGYALLGKTDLVLIVELPGPEQAMKTSLALANTLGISFTTAPAVAMDDFDKLVEGM
jgi:uncharacterized protein with GYD domain